jgi:hypothetical protein
MPNAVGIMKAFDVIGTVLRAALGCFAGVANTVAAAILVLTWTTSSLSDARRNSSSSIHTRVFFGAARTRSGTSAIVGTETLSWAARFGTGAAPVGAPTLTGAALSGTDALLVGALPLSRAALPRHGARPVGAALPTFANDLSKTLLFDDGLPRGSERDAPGGDERAHALAASGRRLPFAVRRASLGTYFHMLQF